MKYIVALFATFFICLDTTSSNLCWYFQNNDDPRLIRRTTTHDSACSCECWQYPHTKGTNNQYRCGNCNHRLTPPDPLSASNITILHYDPTTQETTIEEKSAHFENSPQFIRYNQTREETDNDIELELNSSKERRASKDLYHPLKQQWREKASFPDLRYVDQRRSD